LRRSFALHESLGSMSCYSTFFGDKVRNVGQQTVERQNVNKQQKWPNMKSPNVKQQTVV
jgi:hypothetical protein